MGTEGRTILPENMSLVIKGGTKMQRRTLGRYIRERYRPESALFVSIMAVHEMKLYRPFCILFSHEEVKICHS